MTLLLRGCVATLLSQHSDEPPVAAERRTRPKKGTKPLSVYMGASTVFQALAASSKACSAVHSHDGAARLRLSTHHRQNDDQHEFEALVTLSLTCHIWQETRIQAIVPRPSATKKAAVKFALPETSREKAQHRRRRRLAVVRLCEQIEKLQSKPLMRLNLVVEEGKLWKDQSSRIERPFNRSDTQLSLADVIKHRPASMTEKVKRVLAVLLAYSVLHLHATPWLRPSSFKADNILFFGISATIPLKPYLQSELNETDYGSAHRIDADELDPDDLPSHPFPDIVMLAILLMEIYLTQPVMSLAEQVDMDFEDWEVIDDNMRYSIAIAVYDRFKVDFPDNYRQAIDRCLDPNLGFDESDEELSPDGLKMLIYDDIVQPLEEELDQGFGNTIQIEKLDEIAETMDLSRWGQMRQPKPVSPKSTAPSTPDLNTARSEGSISVSRTSTFWASSERLVSSTGSILSHQDYTVGWICALPRELAAAQALLDELHPPLPQDPSDLNNYTLGRMGAHNVVMACLPSGVMGTVSAARVASNMRSTFRWLRFGLMVGIGGGVPGEKDIRLGDVVVGEPNGPFGGVIQYDFGKTVQNGELLRTGSLNRPPDLLLTAISRLKADHYRNGADLSRHLSGMFEKYPHLSSEFSHPGAEYDVLFESDYDHAANARVSCHSCDLSRQIHREPRNSHSPHIHYGLIASGNKVMRNGKTREELRNDLNVLCFEMEAAGIVDVFPCLVIRGICDYSDSHKNKIWQGYAAATAAAYAKELLSVISGSQIDNAERLGSFQL
ncbi:nucleoside phosphorylase domain-containing protein [Aspergillus recurvatus]